jgi:hypothetical protein
LYFYFLSLLHCKKTSPKAVRKSSYGHPSILSLSLTFFFLLIIQINSFFFSRKRYCDCSLILPFFPFSFVL